MPNTARGGGISRKITNAQDRKRLKESIAEELEVPEGMGVILRTAGAKRAPRPRSSATSNICCACGRRCAS
jgi:Ribonuclease G/E